MDSLCLELASRLTTKISCMCHFSNFYSGLWTICNAGAYRRLVIAVVSKSTQLCFVKRDRLGNPGHFPQASCRGSTLVGDDGLLAIIH